MKKILRFILFLGIIIGSFNFSKMVVNAETTIIKEGKCGESLTYTLEENGSLKISGNGPMYDWEDETQVPWHEQRNLIKYIWGSPPTHIGAYAFKNCTSITEIVYFEWYNNVESIGAHAFEGCTGLTKLFAETEYMEKLTMIGESAFEGCTGLKGKVKIPENVKVMGERAFADCTDISSVRLPDNMTQIGINAFDTQVGVTSVKDSYAYRWAKEYGLKVADSASGEFELIYSVMSNGTAQVIDYIGFPAEDMIIPDEIDGYKVTSIGEDAFSYMEEVTGNVYLSKNLKEIKSCAFAESNFNGDLTIPDGVEVIESGAFCRSGFDGKLILSKNVKEIGGMAFNGCGFQGDLIIPDSVIKMDEDAFAFTGFVDGRLVLSTNLTEVPFNCFHYSDFGGELVIPESVRKINDIAFIMCRNLTDIYVLSGSTQISNTAFIDFRGTEGGYDYEPKLDVIFHCPANSAAYARAEELGYTVVPLEDIHYHSWSLEWSSDGTHHWRECVKEGCNITDNSEKSGYGKHQYINEKDTTCITCEPEQFFVTPKVVEGEFAFCDNSVAELCGKKSKPMKYTFYYDDSWFTENSDVYNHELAQMSIRAAMAAFNSDTAEAKGDNAYYIKSLMTKLGYFYDEKLVQYPDPNRWSIGYAIGSKDISDDTSVLMVAVRGGGYKDEWYNNFIVGKKGDHLGFDQASVQVGDGISAYINKHASELKENVKVWIVGFSRAAAVANLTAADLCNGFIDGISSEDVFAYCFACPQGTVDKNAETSKYSSIKNIVNPSDLVPWVAMNEWGFKRYGVTYYLPFAGVSSDYSTLKGEMRAKYEGMLSYNGLEAFDTRVNTVLDLTNESREQAIAYRDITKEAAYLIGSREKYVNNLLESQIAAIADNVMNKESSDSGILKEVISRAWSLISSGDSLISTLSTMPTAHYPELYMAWLDSLEGDYRNHNGKYLKILVNCPVDVTVLDKTDNVVGKIASDEIVEIEDGVSVYIDRDGQKVIILPCDADYEIKLTATGNGSMTYTVEQWDVASQNSSYLTSYYDVGIEEGDALTGLIPESVEDETAEYMLLDVSGEMMEPATEYTGEEVLTYTVEVVTEGHGKASATPYKLAGEYVIAYAKADQGENFLGWYEGEKLVSTEENYRFRVESDVLLKAKFTSIYNNDVIRLSGDDRYGTAYAVADKLKETLGVEKFDAVVVATGKDFADALSGSYLAVVKRAPILLTNGKEGNVAKLHEYISKNVNEGGTIYILGGEMAVPMRVENVDGYKVERLAGGDRYATNIKILNEAGVTGDSVIVATGKTFADSLSASAVKLPILLVKPKYSLNDVQKAILDKVNNIYIAGGTSAVAEEYEPLLREYGTVERLAGIDRYETSVKVAEKFFEEANVNKAVVASGQNGRYADGLCGGPLAAALDAPLLLVKEGATKDATEYVAENEIAAGYVLGGTGALADATVVEIFNLESADEIIY